MVQKSINGFSFISLCRLRSVKFSWISLPNASCTVLNDSSFDGVAFAKHDIDVDDDDVTAVVAMVAGAVDDAGEINWLLDDVEVPPPPTPTTLGLVAASLYAVCVSFCVWFNLFINEKIRRNTL